MKFIYRTYSLLIINVIDREIQSFNFLSIACEINIASFKNNTIFKSLISTSFCFYFWKEQKKYINENFSTISEAGHLTNQLQTSLKSFLYHKNVFQHIKSIKTMFMVQNAHYNKLYIL